jgi:potassium/hydrogen antiporter
MAIPVILLLVGTLIFAAHFFEWLFDFSKIPNVLLLMLVGLLLGPWLGLVTPEFFGQAGALFSVVVLAIMLFDGGTELRLDVMRESWRGTISLVLVSFFVTMLAVGYLLQWLTDLGPLLSFMLAAVVSGTSSAIVIPLIEQLQIDQRARAILLLESASSDVLSIVITIALLTAYELGRFSVPTVAVGVIISFVGAAIVGGSAGFVWSLLLNKVRHMQNSIFSTPAFVFILFGVSESLGFSGPIAALAFGIALGNISFFKLYLERRHVLWHTLLHPVTISERERSFFSELVFLLQTFFFVFVGLSISLTNTTAVMVGLILVVMMFILRLPVVRWSTSTALPAFDRSVMAAMVPKGLAAAVLATLIVQRGIPGGLFIQDISYTVILFSVVATSLLIFLVYRTGIGRFYRGLVGNGAQDTAPPGQIPPNLTA